MKERHLTRKLDWTSNQISLQIPDLRLEKMTVNPLLRYCSLTIFGSYLLKTDKKYITILAGLTLIGLMILSRNVVTHQVSALMMLSVTGTLLINPVDDPEIINRETCFKTNDQFYEPASLNIGG
ncbi:hypothetical protein NAF17_15940 [Mucilaginibacter sp. RB4R14]|uniref:hypothetical protein n=1 Tax=Mucilaginibacter aurantiaciroseus TaxID=2949308 RepID=UPI002091124E|nr:hypothetical protein [Mucilaginibacter aurantiaciroseus]MCO5937036.1 hypothetical protein [Mucilaginibacter aurantiaciroseus]